VTCHCSTVTCHDNGAYCTLAMQPCPAALPGSLAWQPCLVALPGSLAEILQSYSITDGATEQFFVIVTKPFYANRALTRVACCYLLRAQNLLAQYHHNSRK
jgi:hypothetical protein